MFGKIVKITPAKKLMVKIDEPMHDRIHSRVIEMCQRKNFPLKTPLLTLEDDNGDDAFFAFVTLDKYDRALVSTKFEKMIKKDVKIGFTLAPYDFVGDDGEDVKGINLLLQTIRTVKKKIPEKFLDMIENEVKQLEELADKERTACCGGELVEDTSPIQQFIKHEELQENAAKYVRRRRVPTEDKEDDNTFPFPISGEPKRVLQAIIADELKNAAEDSADLEE